jgi:phage gp16-like protein
MNASSNSKMKAAPTSQNRRVLIAKVHVAKKALGLNDDDYRAVLVRVTGYTSSAMMNDAQLVAVVEEFARKGFDAKARPIGRSKPADHPVALKARALWISLHQLGEIDDPSEAALEAFARRQLKVERLQWADQGQGYKLIEALKSMAERAGWSQRLDGVTVGAKLLVLKRRLVEALMRRVRQADLAPASWTVERAAWEFGGIEEGRPLMFASVEELDLIARTFAAKLHEFRRATGGVR